MRHLAPPVFVTPNPSRCIYTPGSVRPHPHRTRACNFQRKPFDVACVQCEHSHSRTQVPFALRCAFCVDEALPALTCGAQGWRQRHSLAKSQVQLFPCSLNSWRDFTKPCLSRFMAVDPDGHTFYYNPCSPFHLKEKPGYSGAAVG